MDKQKRNAGITLIALVISIIIMLILAGVSINATVGDNGILKQAMKASNKQKLAQEIENLNLELAKLNIDTITNNEADTIQNIVDYLIKQGVIDEAVKTSSGAIAVGVDRETGSKYFFGKKGENIYKISRGKDDILLAELSQSVSGGEIEGGSSLVTSDSFDNDSSLPPEEKGKFNITSDATVAFMDTISGELCFYIKSGVHASIEIYADMTLTNEGIKRSAIDIESGGTLDLYVGDGVNLTVNSGLGEDAQGSVAGKGGYAGIHVPEGAELNLYGSGTVIAIGGDAGDGFVGSGLQAGGGGAGAGIGGKGGNGGEPASGVATDEYRASQNGGDGEDAGAINIYNDITVYAYGGAGGSGGTSTNGNGGGAGGYPAAGIGGGGAGGAGATCCTGAGGYSGGSGGSYDTSLISKNGLYGHISERSYAYWGGGGYYSGAENYTKNDEKIQELCFGGFGGTSYYRGHRGGDGGTAGKGGNVKVSESAKICAFNGNLYTDGTNYNEGLNQTPIYLQAGIKVAQYDVASWEGKRAGGEDAKTRVDNPQYPLTTNLVSLEMISELQKNIDLSNNQYVNTIYTTNDNFKSAKTLNINTVLDIKNNPLTNVDMSKQGIGSGAGYVEISNGTYTVDSSLN